MELTVTDVLNGHDETPASPMLRGCSERRSAQIVRHKVVND